MIFVYLLLDLLAGIYIGGCVGYILSKIEERIFSGKKDQYGRLSMELNVIFFSMIGACIGFFTWALLHSKEVSVNL